MNKRYHVLKKLIIPSWKEDLRFPLIGCCCKCCQRTTQKCGLIVAVYQAGGLCSLSLSTLGPTRIERSFRRLSGAECDSRPAALDVFLDLTLQVGLTQEHGSVFY